MDAEARERRRRKVHTALTTMRETPGSDRGSRIVETLLAEEQRLWQSHHGLPLDLASLTRRIVEQTLDPATSAAERGGGAISVPTEAHCGTSVWDVTPDESLIPAFASGWGSAPLDVLDPTQLMPWQPADELYSRPSRPYIDSLRPWQEPSSPRTESGGHNPLWDWLFSHAALLHGPNPPVEGNPISPQSQAQLPPQSQTATPRNPIAAGSARVLRKHAEEELLVGGFALGSLLGRDFFVCSFALFLFGDALQLGVCILARLLTLPCRLASCGCRSCRCSGSRSSLVPSTSALEQQHHTVAALLARHLDCILHITIGRDQHHILLVVRVGQLEVVRVRNFRRSVDCRLHIAVRLTILHNARSGCGDRLEEGIATELDAHDLADRLVAIVPRLEAVRPAAGRDKLEQIRAVVRLDGRRRRNADGARAIIAGERMSHCTGRIVRVEVRRDVGNARAELARGGRFELALRVAHAAADGRLVVACDRVGLAKRVPEPVPHGTARSTVAACLLVVHAVDLLQGGVGELEHVDDADQTAVDVYDGQVEVSAIVHLAQRLLDGQRGRGGVGVRRHDTHHRARLGVEARSDDTQDDVLGRKDAGDLARDGATAADLAGARTGAGGLHDADCGGVVLLHETSRLADGGAHADAAGERARVEDGREIGDAHLLAQRLNVLEHGLLRARRAAPLALDALEGVVELLGGAVGAFELLERLVEHLCDVEQADDVAVLVADGKVTEAARDHGVERLGGRSGVAGDHGRACHDGGDGRVSCIQASRDHTEGEVLGGEDAGEMLFLVDDEHAVGALGSAQLTRIGDADGLGNGECGQRTQRRDGAGGGDGRTRRALGAARGDGRSGLARLALQFALDLLANGLEDSEKGERASVQLFLEVELMLEVEVERGRLVEGCKGLGDESSWRTGRGMRDIHGEPTRMVEASSLETTAGERA
ncbi:hypothetical protein L1887_55604 [Cichorium endivia]|nr:hypothetical protein L1887_55604 [Cichorium endivia]